MVRVGAQCTIESLMIRSQPMHIVRNEALCLSFLLTKGSTVMLGMLPTKDRKSADMLWNAAESQPCLCWTMLIDQVVSTASPESKRCHLFL